LIVQLSMYKSLVPLPRWTNCHSWLWKSWTLWFYTWVVQVLP
jgi:hypothetical protein